MLPRLNYCRECHPLLYRSSREYSFLPDDQKEFWRTLGVEPDEQNNIISEALGEEVRLKHIAEQPTMPLPVGVEPARVTRPLWWSDSEPVRDEPPISEPPEPAGPSEVPTMNPVATEDQQPSPAEQWQRAARRVRELARAFAEAREREKLDRQEATAAPVGVPLDLPKVDVRADIDTAAVEPTSDETLTIEPASAEDQEPTVAAEPIAPVEDDLAVADEVPVPAGQSEPTVESELDVVADPAEAKPKAKGRPPGRTKGVSENKPCQERGRGSRLRA